MTYKSSGKNLKRCKPSQIRLRQTVFCLGFVLMIDMTTARGKKSAQKYESAKLCYNAPKYIYN